MHRLITFLTLFTSLSTLMCCALPALFVALGAGAVFSSLLGIFPQLIWISEHKTMVFIVAGGFLILGGAFQWRVRNAPCPIDPQLAKACVYARRKSLIIYCLSLGLYVIGSIFSFGVGFFF